MDKAIIQRLQELGADVCVMEAGSDVAAKRGAVAFDGFFWGCVHSDFRPLKMVSHENLEQIISRADQRLYKGKNNGRDHVEYTD